MSGTLERGQKVIAGLTVDNQPVVIYEMQFGHLDKYLEWIIDIFKQDSKAVLYYEARKILFCMVSDCSNLGEAKFRKLAGRQVLACINAFKELNAPFLDCLEALGVKRPNLESIIFSGGSEANSEKSSESPEENPALIGPVSGPN